MKEGIINCPSCGEEIVLSEALIQPIQEELRKDFETKIQKKDKDLAKVEKELEKSKKNLKKQIEQEVKKNKKKIEKAAKMKAEKETKLQFEDLQEQIEEKDQKLEEAEKEELKLRKLKRQLEEKERKMELDMNRQLDEERKKIQEDTFEKAKEEFKKKEIANNEKIEGMKKQIDELKRKAEQGSQQLQGEVFELEMEDLLRSTFPNDEIEPVPTSYKGADLLQKVNGRIGQCCGTIVWEVKQTKRWSNTWIDKVKDDQRKINAEVAVIVSSAMPNEIKSFGFVNKVLVTNYQSVVPATILLRNQIIQVSQAKQSTVGKNEKMELLWGYLTGTNFHQRVEAIGEALTDMKKDLDREKTAMSKRWAKREKQMWRAVYGIAGLYGDMQGVIGASLPEIESLSLKELPEHLE